LVEGRGLATPVTQFDGIQARHGAAYATVTASISGRPPILLDGIPNATASEMMRVLKGAFERSTQDQETQSRAVVAAFRKELHRIEAWSRKSFSTLTELCKKQEWVTREVLVGIAAARPDVSLNGATYEALRPHFRDWTNSDRRTILAWFRGYDVYAALFNKTTSDQALRQEQEFFQIVEKSELTEEQARAVVCMDSRVLLVASAGSGKTSTIVAKAGYVLKRGYVKPERVLLLAFNTDAAKELRRRIDTRLGPLGICAEAVQTKTFHAFGLDIIGQATGRRPMVAPWLEAGKDVAELLKIINALRTDRPGFRLKWMIFKMVAGRDLPQFGDPASAPVDWDAKSRAHGFRTIKGEVVKSQGELMLADWFAIYGVNYVYEGEYRVGTASAEHRQYCPDFYFPDIDVYLEHWATDQNGDAPAHFKDYKVGMKWKRQLHALNRTTLLETTFAGVWNGEAFEYLERELTRRGVKLKPNLDLEETEEAKIKNQRMAVLLRTFLVHAKSNRIAPAKLQERLQGGVAGPFRYRNKLFLSLYEDIREAWDSHLRTANHVDFEDMLVMAADCIEAGKWQSPFDLVMVDEFQDVSSARARMLQELIKGPGHRLFCVGDDWQSVNRFAGSDPSVMTDFQDLFGAAEVLRLETTFRCPQSLCDISSNFVQRNPKQIAKQVRSAKSNVHEPIRLISVASPNLIKNVIRQRIIELVNEARGNPTLGDRLPTVFILGRYRRDHIFIPEDLPVGSVRVKFLTVHSAKGLEADHVIIPRATSGILGFPSGVNDDPLLRLAMPGAENFPDAEERRLFYVALTRARFSVTILTLAGKESPFLVELSRSHSLTMNHFGHERTSPNSSICPACKMGFLKQRKSEYGKFLGCSRYPRCRFKR
jgi:DNA helicase-4